MLPVPDPLLRDDVIALRLCDERDLAVVERGVRDPEVVRAFGPLTLTGAEVLELNRGRWERDEGATFAICTTSDRCVGLVFVNLDRERRWRGMVGYWLLPEARGLGLATRAVRLISRWALEELGLDRVGLFAEPWNEASLRVAERSGFRREGVLRSFGEVDGRRVDFVSFSLLPGDLGTRSRVEPTE